MEEARELVEHNEKKYIATNLPKATGTTEIAKETRPLAAIAFVKKTFLMETFFLQPLMPPLLISEHYTAKRY